VNRIFLFLATNLAVMVVFSVISSVFGLDQLLGASNLSLLVYAAVFGFVGSFISLFLSKSMAIRSMGVHLIEQPANATERWLLETVHAQAREAGIGLPEVGIFQQASPNAFATGWNKNDSLVAVSTGLLDTMTKDEVEAVLGHEVAHIYNGDMVTMGLIQGVLNTFVIIFSNLLGKLLSGNRGGGAGYLVGQLIGNFVFGFLASLIAAWFSRQREYRADAGGARLAGRENMISALAALQRVSGQGEPLPDKQLAAFGISGMNVARLTSTHPPLEVRIARLKAEA